MKGLQCETYGIVPTFLFWKCIFLLILELKNFRLPPLKFHGHANCTKHEFVIFHANYNEYWLHSLWCTVHYNEYNTVYSLSATSFNVCPCCMDPIQKYLHAKMIFVCAQLMYLLVISHSLMQCRPPYHKINLSNNSVLGHGSVSVEYVEDVEYVEYVYCTVQFV